MNALILETMPSLGIALICIFGIVAVVLLLLFLIPSLKPKDKDKSEEEIAKDEVKKIVISPKEKTPFQKEILDDKARKEISKRESELNFIFTDDDIEALVVQVEQDWKDEQK